jgi:hypothetical protein
MSKGSFLKSLIIRLDFLNIHVEGWTCSLLKTVLSWTIIKKALLNKYKWIIYNIHYTYKKGNSLTHTNLGP